jgi:pyrroline-5-carboxylate reductase
MVAGSGELLARSELPASTLRANVTSPGGTTAAALEVLMREPGLAGLMREAVAAAKRRAGELSG